MGARLRAFDWSTTALGPAQSWPQSLKTIVRVMLDSRYAMWMLWGPERTFFCNDAYLPTLGIKRDWALGARSDKVWEEIWPEIGPRIQQVLDHGQATWDEALQLFLERRGFTEESYHTFSYSPVYNDESLISGMLCVVTEVTDKVVGERRLRILKDLAARSVGSAGVAETCLGACEVLDQYPFSVPFAGIYLRDSTAGVFRRAAVTRQMSERILPVCLDASDPTWPLAKLLESETAEHIANLPARGVQVPAEPWPDLVRDALILPLKGAGGEPLGGVLIAAASPRLAFDDSCQMFFSLVAAQITAAIADAQATERDRRRAEALAELDRAKTAFFSNVSHEFRTPLTLMLGPIEQASRHPHTPAPVRAQLELAHRNALRLLKLVNSLLDFARLEAGRMQASYEPTDLAVLTRELASTFQSAMDQAGLTFNIECAEVGEPVHVDREMWEKIVLNLLSNAFKFTLRGSVTVRLRREARSALLQVVDTGAGIPTHELPRLFERFHRIQGTEGRTHEGSGIGLALVQELTRLHGGSVRAQSEPGRGSIFEVALPLGSEHLPAEHLRAARSPPAALPGARAFVQEALRWIPTNRDGRVRTSPALFEESMPEQAVEGAGARILLADDNADMRHYLAELLAPAYRVEAVSDGEQALAAAHRERPDLIISDVMMPHVGGLELLQALRADEALCEVPLILLSARAGEEARIAGLGAGADDYLVKPFSARELLARVGARLELTRMRRESEQRLREEKRVQELLAKVSRSLVAAQLDLAQVVQIATDAATELAGAAFGAFFYTVQDESGESYVLYTLSGAPREAFERFPQPRSTSIFGPTFRGEPPLRSDDITADPRYGHNPPYHGMPEHHLPVRSYLAVPVKTSSGEVLGGLFFGHPEPGVFDERAEQLVLALAAQAAVAFENARLHQLAQLEVKHQSSLATLGAIVDSSDDAIISKSLDGTIQSWNAAAQRIFGWTAEEAVGHSINLIIPPDRLEEERRILETLARGERISHFETTRMSRDGQLLAVSLTVSPIRNAAGEVIGASKIARDIGERKHAERMLQQREQELRDSNQRKDEFLAMLAHELRNPLAPIGYATELLARTRIGDQRALAAVGMLKRQSAQLTRLVDDLLDVSRITQGRIQLRREPVDVAAVIGQAVETVQPQLREKRHELSVMASSYGALYVDGDFARLVQCVGNILTNATKYTDAGGEIRLRTRADAQAVVIEITDNGSGIAPELMPRIFDLFVQSERTLDRAQGGLGVGLALVKRLVEMHQGQISARSEGIGRGSTFEIRLPRIERPEKRREPTASAGPQAPRRVLIVDDNEDAADSLAMLLSADGHETQVAYGARQALECLERFRPDVALLDIGLPEMDGYELARRMRAIPPLQNLRLVALTGYGQVEDRQRAQRAGFDAHLVKPVDLPALERALTGPAGAG
ncbi:MAG TPA: ATP-binding protein [Steroidobacteraceae bacterium]|nr:ATP-binding protein [Steroidobacteraceae bacterium]